MFRKVLVTVDRSPFAEAALDRVPDINAAAVVILHVVEPVASILAREVPAFDVPPDIATSISQAEREAAAAYLSEAATKLRGAGVGQVSTLMREGRPGPEIVAAAREEGCDLVVMSTHGRSGIRRALLGSVANHVTTHVEDGAILLVRPPQD
ncbi:MAG TPA: universal stress protein [Dehalococcoidia bacterium]|nr:universal stress protein [Dehalococcoidia bacterium]